MALHHVVLRELPRLGQCVVASSRRTMPPLCAACNLSRAFETPTLCNEGSSWRNKMIAITFRRSYTYRPLHCVRVLAVGIFPVQSASVNKAQRANPKEKKESGRRKRRAEKVNSCYDRLGRLWGFWFGFSAVILSSGDKQGALVWNVTCAASPDASQRIKKKKERKEIIKKDPDLSRSLALSQ